MVDITKAILTEAKGLFDTPDRWIRCDYYQDDTDNAVYKAEEACSFCIEGAVFKTLDTDINSPILNDTEEELKFLFQGFTHTNSIVQFNDDPDTTFNDVLRAFDYMIERAPV